MPENKETAGDHILGWLHRNPREAQMIAFTAIAGLYLDDDYDTILPEDDCYPRGDGSDYVDEVGHRLERAGIMPLIQGLQKERDEDE